MRAYLTLFAIILAVSCGGSKGGSDGAGPAGPSLTTPTGQTWTLSGQVTDSVTGTPVSAAVVTIDGRTLTPTDSQGRWRMDGSGSAQPRLSTTIQATGFLPRETFITWQPEGRQSVALEMIPERAPFVLSFYRYLVRNGLEEPGSPQAVRRWTTNPNFYIQTYNPKTALPLTAQEVESLVNAIRQTVPQLTGGALNAGTIESGVASRSPRRDYIIVKMAYEPDEDFCGRALVGANPGQIEINYDRCSRSCSGSSRIPPAAVAHEVGHALGFWHVDRGLMAAVMPADCANVQFSEAERVHARIAYRRPAGNVDPDRDPTTFAASSTASAPSIACGLPPR